MSGAAIKPNRRKYVPRLSTFQAVCEANYARVLRLLPDCDTEDLSYQFSINNALDYQIRIVDSSRYTSTLEFCQQSATVPKYLRPVMFVRLYHDAQMAEVLNTQNVGALQPSYQYPNAHMHQKNEKEMVNHFLSEWLVFCLQNEAQQSSRA